MRPLAITGCSCVTPFGVGREAFRLALRDPEAARACIHGQSGYAASSPAP